MIMNTDILDLNKDIDFDHILKSDIEKVSRHLMNWSDDQLKTIYKVHKEKRTIENTLVALDDIYNELTKVHSLITLLAYVHPEDTFREKCLRNATVLGQYFNKIAMDKNLYHSFIEFKKAGQAKSLSGEVKKFFDETLQEFELNGLGLKEDDRREVEKIKNRLSELELEFESNINNHEDHLIINKSQAEGLPKDYLEARKQPDGNYKIDLSYPSYHPFMKYCRNDDLRKQLYTRFLNRAADKNPELLKAVLSLRKKLAEVLGFKSYAEYSLKTKMARTPSTVWDFEKDLQQKLEPKAIEDFKELLHIKNELDGKDHQKINAWEVSYLLNILKEDKYKIDEQELKGYFKLENVVEGLFRVAGELFGLRFEEQASHIAWHEDVKFYYLYDENKLQGKFYLDLFPRKGKFGHAACFTMIPGRAINGEKQISVATLVCNFPEPHKDKPSLLTHNEVVTLFHEFGHLLHALLSKNRFSAFSGTNVKRDFVEMPSQIFENWAWNYDALKLFAIHYHSGKILPETLYHKMLETKNVNSGNFYLQQIFYGMLDMTLHDNYEPSSEIDINDIVKELQNQITLFPYVKGTHFEAGFAHLMGYSAGYYSYLWAKVYAEDMFSVFQKEGILNKKQGKRLKNIILEKGGSEDEMRMLMQYLDRKPDMRNFLNSIGYLSSKTSLQ